MDTKEPPTMTLKQIISAVEKISVDDQEKLLAELKDKAWARAANRLLHTDFEQISQSFLDSWAEGKLFDHLSAHVGDVQIGINTVSEKWSDRLKILARMQDPQFNEKLDLSQEEIEEKLEDTYHQLQSQLTVVRIAVASAIATEKHLKMELEKNISQSEIWQARATMAYQQGNNELAQCALERKQQIVYVAEELTKQLAEQRLSSQTLRQQFSECEALASKIYSQKQILMARNKFASALAIVHELVVDLCDQDIDKRGASSGHALNSDTLEVVSKTLSTLERATATIIALEGKVQALEKKIGSSEDQSSN